MNRKKNDDHSDLEGDDREVLVTEHVFEGYRLIDVAILIQNIASQLACTLCHGTIQRFEVSRKGTVSEFAFHCENPRCSSQQSFPSCAQITAEKFENTFCEPSFCIR